MDDLHRPLGQTDSPRTASRHGSGIGKAALLLVAVLAGAGAYLGVFREIGTVQQDTVIAIDRTTVSSIESAQELKPEATGEVTEGRLDEDESVDDDTEVAMSSELAPMAPTFKPKQTEIKERPVHLPDPDLVEKSEFGPLPRIADSGLRPLDAYAVRATSFSANRVAIVVGGMGLSQSGSLEAIERLPSEITLGFSPFGNSLNRWMAAARREGHEVVLQLPMEPLGYPAVSPGPQTLASQLKRGENLKNLRWSLGRMTNYPLVMNYLGANLSNKQAAFMPILEEIKARGLAYLDDGTAQTSQAAVFAKQAGLPFAQGSIVLDNDRREQAIDAQLSNLEALAKRRGFAIATATAFPVTVERIAEWAKGASKRGILIVPVTALVRDPG